jgi:DNA-binding NarL/FixJ family response regulator
MPLNKTAAGEAAKVLIVDDHPAIREALALRISTQPDLEVCGEAADMAEALRLAGTTTPDVAVIDVALKTGNGLDLIKRLLARNENLRTIVWSMYSEDLYAERALRAGAMGYINKEQATGQIIEAIRQVLDGKVYLSGAMTAKLLKRAVGPGGRTRRATRSTTSPTGNWTSSGSSARAARPRRLPSNCT